jgi:putative chitobiose transport system permease protein
MKQTHTSTIRATASIPQAATSYRSTAGYRRAAETILVYFLLCLVALITFFPFVWVLFTSFKGPTDPIFSVPPQLIPHEPTFANYLRVWQQMPVPSFFMNSILVAVSTVILNVLICALAAYPFAKMKFPGRDIIFYLLLVTFIVPVQLTYIPSFVLAVKVFHYYDSLRALILPNLASAFNIFMLRQAFKSVPDDLIDAAKIDGASELRTWWSILLPVIRPSLATVAIITFVTQWNDFLWPSLMLHTREKMTLQVGLVALQGMFASDSRGVAAGVVMTVIPILIVFVTLQKYFVRGMSGAVKG